MKINWRHWHAWLSIVLSIPLFLVGVTAVLIAHNKTLGLKDMPLNWLSDSPMRAAELPEIRASLSSRDGRRFLGGKSGLYVLQHDKIHAVAALAGSEVRSLSENQQLLVAAGSMGAWLLNGETWRAVYRKPVHQAHIGADNSIFLATVEHGLLVSRDLGASWQADQPSLAALQTLPPAAVRENYSFNKLVMDVHTGKAFMGKSWEWLWIDCLGLLLVFLALSGVYLWWQGQKRQTALHRS
ncbi:MAG: PepSY domain-containing protein [Methylomonas sp.]|nr:PepSY domain-containing protein [Methylomonas sp.]